MAEHILFAEDDPAIRMAVSDTLTTEGYEIEAVENGEQALDLIATRSFDLLILDIMMPKLSGYDVCREVRKTDQEVSILFLSAKSEEIDKVVGLQLGADDYVTKPFGMYEFLARVQAMLRRRGIALPNESAVEGAAPESIQFGAVIFEYRKRQLISDGRNLPLTNLECQLLLILAEHSNEALSRDYLLDKVWGINYQGTTRTLDQHIAQLRQKIEPNPRSPIYIHTVHGYGYRLQLHNES